VPRPAPMAKLPASPVDARQGRTGVRLTMALELIRALGTGLRLSQVRVQVLSGAETHGALRISGSFLARVNSELGHGHPVQALQAPEHPLLDDLAAMGWQRQFAADTTDLRLLSALFGIALIPAIAVRAWERWQSATLASICPLDVLHAHDLRHSSFWAALTAPVAWLLLQAFRSGPRSDLMLSEAGPTALPSTQGFSLGLVAALSLPHPLSWNWRPNLTRPWLDLDPSGRLNSGDESLQFGLLVLAMVPVVLGAVLAWNWILSQLDRRPAALLLELGIQLRHDADLQRLPAGALTCASLTQERPLLPYRPSLTWLSRLPIHLGGFRLVPLAPEDGPDAQPMEQVPGHGADQDRR